MKVRVHNNAPGRAVFWVRRHTHYETAKHFSVQVGRPVCVSVLRVNLAIRHYSSSRNE